MVSKRPNTKDTVSDKNSNIRISLIIKKFHGNQFSRITNFKNFAGIIFRKLTFSGVKKENHFREFGQNSRNSRNFLIVKISFFKVLSSR